MLSPDLFDLLRELPSQQHFSRFVESAGKALRADRCFLYMRNPHTRIGRTPFCWCRNKTIPPIYNEDWFREIPEELEQQDPMFAAALDGRPSIYIEDVEKTSPTIINKEFEALHLGGHRALIHAHLLIEGTLWGVFQPSVFHHARVWTKQEREIVERIIPELSLCVRDYVKAHAPSLMG